MKKYLSIPRSVCVSSLLLSLLFLSADARSGSRGLFDEYGDLKSNAEKSRLDNYFMELQNNPNAQGYVVVFAPVRRQSARARFIMSYVKARGLDTRITLRRKTAEGVSTQLWVVSAGEAPPR